MSTAVPCEHIWGSANGDVDQIKKCGTIRTYMELRQNVQLQPYTKGSGNCSSIE